MAWRAHQREKVRAMFQRSFDSYMTHAFPLDELDPVHCTGRGPDYAHPDNININDGASSACSLRLPAISSPPPFPPSPPPPKFSATIRCR